MGEENDFKTTTGTFAKGNYIVRGEIYDKSTPWSERKPEQRTAVKLKKSVKGEGVEKEGKVVVQTKGISKSKTTLLSSLQQKKTLKKGVQTTITMDKGVQASGSQPLLKPKLRALITNSKSRSRRRLWVPQINYLKKEGVVPREKVAQTPQYDNQDIDNDSQQINIKVVSTPAEKHLKRHESLKKNKTLPLGRKVTQPLSPLKKQLLNSKTTKIVKKRQHSKVASAVTSRNGSVD